MASNLNKAFMRAYAKDRSVPADDTPTAAAPTAPIAEPAKSQPLAESTAQPSMQPTIFAGRYAPPKPASDVADQRTEQRSSAMPTATSSANVHRIPAPSLQQSLQPGVSIRGSAPERPVVQRSAPQHNQPTTNNNQSTTNQPTTAQSTNPTTANQQAPAKQAPAQQAPTQQPIAQQPPVMSSAASRPVPSPAVSSPSIARPTAEQPSTRVESNHQSANGDPTRVWQRIDAAHQSQPTHPTEMQSRPSVSVGATRTATPKRMQAAAPTPAPSAPAPTLRVDAPSQPSARPLPLVGDEAQPAAEPQQAEARRRTVADFLYSAGQYNPGRILASADNSQATIATSTAMPTASMRTSEVARPMERTAQPAAASYPMMDSMQTMNSSAMADAAMMDAAMMDTLQASGTSTVAAPTHTYMPPAESPAVEEAMPRRMGQILRVDVPRGHAAVAMPPAAPAVAPAKTPAAMPAATPATMPAAMPTAMPAQTAPSVDAPVAKYVLEQRRLDRAHKLNETEEKLRRNTHKVFNPVWEVDNLQWPTVVDKLMQQRAQSMAHVAEHLKTACQDGLSVLGVTSASQAEGRTTVACCLARLAAAHGLNVALVDIDLDHPTLCVQTNMEVENDWRDCLSEDITLEEVAVHSIDDQLTVLPLKPRGTRPGLLASDSRIADILNDLSDCFELVIVDCSKTSSSGNVITGLAHTKIFDAAIVVVDRRDGEADRVEDAVRMIQQTGIESIGIVDNFSM